MAINFVPKSKETPPVTPKDIAGAAPSSTSDTVSTESEQIPVAIYKSKSKNKKTTKATKTSSHLPEEHSIPYAPAEKRALTRTQRRNATTKATKEDMDRWLEESGTPRNDELVSYEGKENQQNGKRARATKEAMEYRRKQIMRLVLRGVPKSTIAEHLGLPIRQVYEDMMEINREMRDQLTNFDYQGYIGMSLAFYEEARNIALRLATDTNEKSNNVKMSALRTALMAESEKTDFLAKVGLFKVAAPTDPFNSINTGRQGSYSDENDLNTFLQSIAKDRAKVYGGHSQPVQDVETVGGEAKE